MVSENICGIGGYMKKRIQDIKNMMLKKNIENNFGIIGLSVIIFIFITFTAIYLIGTKNISGIEKKELLRVSDNFIYYIEDIKDSKSKDIDKYIIYALDYTYNNDSKNSMTCDEIYDFLTENFTIKTSAEEIKNIGVTPLMLERNIVYDDSKQSYMMVGNSDARKIAETPIVYYKIEKISKSNKKRFVIKYKKYVIENPYDMLNYYIDKNTNSSNEENNDKKDYNDLVDIVPIRNYLLGNGKIIDFKKTIKDEDISKFAKSSGTLKVTYVVKDDKIYIDKIK